MLPACQRTATRREYRRKHRSRRPFPGKSTTGGNTAVYALKADGTVWSWGHNGYGRLGIGTTTFSAVPVKVTGLTGARNVTGDQGSAFALKTDGTIWAWGNNLAGQLGNGTITNSSVPVQVR